MRQFEGVRARFATRAFARRVTVVLSLVIALVAALGATGASADPAVSQTFTTNYTFDNPCTGEIFAGMGTGHF